MKRINLKKRKKHKKHKIIIIIITIIVILNYINKKISPKLTHYAEEELKKISNLVITQSISMEDIEKINIDELFIITRNSKNEILTVDLNTILVNKLITIATKNIQENLKQLELGKLNEYNEYSNGVIIKIPLGEITNNFIFNEIGPKIPVKLKIMGNMDAKLNTKVTNYGINNALIETSLDITIKEEVLLPINTSEITVVSSIPLSVKLISGTVPNFYSNGIIKESALNIPLE